ncbi:hypothetical protein D9619_007801 [Psilocybe cf. subviscida]|uniref:RRM domain-containing protein n=1 Tax=Psilocybe cf. subviscida TaxID=2480587 RepID=A0A8H5AUN4_9AGAR|nr:hypothetical protein D9619_007801 [Psilocybe cf. subviscida]
MDKSLEEIIKSKPKTARRGAGPRRTSARTQILGKPTTTPSQRARATAPADPTKAVAQNSEKIIVSNLPPDVNEAQVRDLFRTTVGPLKELTLHYDAGGRSKGIASVTFQRKGDADAAFASYNNRLIDGS